MLETVWADEQGVPASDRGLAYGDGLFETLRIAHGTPTLLEYHLRRMLDGATRLAIPLTRVQLTGAVESALEHFQHQFPQDGKGWVLKLVLTRGSGGRGYLPPENPTPRLIISSHPLPVMPNDSGIEVGIADSPLVVDPAIAGVKSLNRLAQVQASLGIRPGWFEMLMCDSTGCLVEGTRTNLFALLGDTWVTPPVSSLAVAGVARAALIDHLNSNGVPVEEYPLLMAMFYRPDFGGLILTNSVMGAVPVSRIDAFQLPISDRLATIVSFLSDAVGS
ncbi:aminotransferase class IV [Marinobacter sp. 1Y8]